MREYGGKLLLVLCAGALIGWFARGTIGDRAERSRLDNPTVASTPLLDAGRFSTSSQSSPGANTRPPKEGKKAAESPRTVGAASAPAARIDRLPIGRANSGDSLADTASQTVSSANLTHSDPDIRPQGTPLQDLLTSTSIGCTFGAGNSAEWPSGKLRIGTSAWQGGPVDFQSIDINAGTAQMNGSGVTRIRSASIGVTVVPTDSGLNISGIVGHGTLVVTTIFSRLDAAGHHIAVMSSHGLIGMETAQFYGTCDTVQQSN
jgi:hypothetical protein